jgi:hypothetical protein
MNNIKAAKLIEDCKIELKDIDGIIQQTDPFNKLIPFLTNYAIIKTCGTIEQSFKTIIADFCQFNQNTQVQNYIQNTFRESSQNPSYDNICKSLAAFDNNWNDLFKIKIKNKKNNFKLKTSLKSLNQARNTFAHGGTTSVSFQYVIDYFQDSLVIIETLDSVVK